MSARSATGPTAVIANQDHGVATIVDLARWSVAAHVDVKMHPHEAAASPDGRSVALASPSTWLGDASTIAIIDVPSAALVRSIDLGTFRWPHGLAYLDAKTLVVSSRARSGILFADAESGAALASAEAPGSRPYLLQVATETGRIYTSSPATNVISEYDVAGRGFVRELAVPGEPAGFAVSPGGGAVWVSTGAHDGSGAIVVLDAASGVTRARLPVRGHARRLSFTAEGRCVVATDVADHSVLVFDAEKRQEIGRIPLGSDVAPSGVACDPVTARCYVSTIRSGELVDVDVSAMRVLRRLDVGTGADGVVLVAPLDQRSDRAIRRAAPFSRSSKLENSTSSRL